MYPKNGLFLFCLFIASVATAQLPYPYSAPQLEVSLEGQALACNDSSIDFGNHPVGTHTEVVITITNTGSAPAIVYGIELLGAPEFSVEFSAPIEGATYLAAGSQLSVPIGFHPSAIGAFTGAISIESSDPEHSSCPISLIGNGTPPNPLQVGFTDDPLTGYAPINCGEEAYFDIISTGTNNGFLVFYNFQNTGETSITLRAESTVVGSIGTTILNPINMSPGFASGFSSIHFLPAGQTSTILTTFFITLEDGTEITCEHRVIVDVSLTPISIIFSPDPSQGYESVECGEEAFFDLTGTTDALFSVHYTITNSTEEIISIGAETTIEGTNLTSILPAAPVEPQANRHKFAHLSLDAGSVYSILTTIFITLADGTEIACEHRVIVDKSPGVNRPGRDIRGYTNASPTFKIYPTLATEQVTLEAPALVPDSYQIINNNGQVLQEGVIPVGQYRTQISTASLGAGQYFLKVGQDHQILRFIISKN